MKTTRTLLILCAACSIGLAGWAYLRRYQDATARYEYHHRMLLRCSAAAQMHSVEYGFPMLNGMGEVISSSAELGNFNGISLNFNKTSGSRAAEYRRQADYHREMRARCELAMRYPWRSAP